MTTANSSSWNFHRQKVRLPKLNCKNFNFGFYFLHVNFRVKHMYNPGIWVSFNSHGHACSQKLSRNTFISGLCDRLELDFSNSMPHTVCVILYDPIVIQLKISSLVLDQLSINQVFHRRHFCWKFQPGIKEAHGIPA